jgi:Domain of unknown function (DUF4082)/Bacterial Ig-like domain
VKTHTGQSGISRGAFLRRVGGGVATIAVAGAAAPDILLGAVPTPTGLTALALDSSVVLAWQPVAGASGYVVLRGPAAGSPTAVVSGSGGVSGTSFTDASANNGSAYCYAVQAIVSGSQSGNSNLVAAAPVPRGTSSGNAIAVENSFPGSTAWKMQGAAQPPTGIEGFATATSINAGDRVDLKINTADGAPYHIEIYRAGYYGGAQARLISQLTGLTGVGQDNPQKNPDLGLIDASNWGVSATITTTSDWQTGVYMLRLARDDNACDNHILLVVRNDGASSDIVYGLPVSTYQAYNKWGGKSLYTFNSSGDATVAGSPRAVKVSFDRPYNQSLDGLNNWFTACDIQNLSWLEHQGYDVTYVTNLDVHTGTNIGNHSVYISPSHDEYWSSEMRSAVTNARDSGVGLFFLGANGVYWRIRFEQNPYSGAANRIQVCYKTSESGASDPVTPTTTWRDPAGANQPENGLIGQMYIGDNGSVFFPLVVSAAQGLNRIWRYTTLTSLAPNTTSKIGKNLVGWEWDARYPANGAEPAGVTVIAASPVTGELIQDAGSVFTNGPATANATVYRTAGGTRVFATGTNQWSRGLGVNMAGVGEPSTFVQQATVNMLQDMDARPTTPASGVVLDTLGAAQLVSTTPTDGATGAGVAAAITAKFDRALDPPSVNAQTVTLSGPGGPVQASVAYADSTHTVTLTPAQPLAVGTQYTATLTTGVLAIDDTPLPAPITFGFTTVVGPFSLFAASLAPVSTHNPVKDGRGGAGPFSYEMGVKVQALSQLQLTAIRFYKDAAETGTHTGRVWNASGQVIGQTTFTGESASGWQQQSLGSPVTLQPGQVYTVSVGLNAFFDLTQLGLQAQITSGALQSVADGKNGVFGSAAGVFPTSTYKSSNYFVDLVAQ